MSLHAETAESELVIIIAERLTKELLHLGGILVDNELFLNIAHCTTSMTKGPQGNKTLALGHL